jgi:2'-5' RNA ligase
MVAYSRAIGELSVPVMRLGETAPPHLTILHFSGSDDTARSVWAQVAGAQPSTVTVDSAGVAFAPLPEGDLYVPEGGVAVVINVVRRRDLDRLHRAVLDLATARGAEVIGRVGDDFRPHITLNVLERVPIGAVELPQALLSQQFTCTLALGRLGDYGTFPEILESSDR